VPAAGVPLRTPVVVLKVTPLGSAPNSLSVGFGVPVAVTVKLPAKPSTNVVLIALIITGALLNTPAVPVIGIDRVSEDGEALLPCCEVEVQIFRVADSLDVVGPVGENVICIAQLC
jgi:hypothetical protein